MRSDVTVVGAGLTGLTAAIEAAERGWSVTVAEAHSKAGGRARSLAAPFKANTGPHGIYVDGPWWAWLERRCLTPPVVQAPRDANLVRAAGRFGPWPAGLSEAIAGLPAQAPVQESFRAWLLKHVQASLAEAIIGLVFIATYDHDPGRLSARFAHERLQRLLADGVRYVVGGWSTLVGLLAERAASLGVHIRTGTRTSTLPAGPAILATNLATARRQAGDSSLAWSGARVATFDVGLRSAGDPGWFRVMDTDNRIYAARYSRADPSLAPDGHELIQIAAACAPQERKADAERRVHDLLDQSLPGWRARAPVVPRHGTYALHGGDRPARDHMARPPGHRPRHCAQDSDGPVSRARPARRGRSRRGPAGRGTVRRRSSMTRFRAPGGLSDAANH